MHQADAYHDYLRKFFRGKVVRSGKTFVPNLYLLPNG
jgi:hypothetical protein